MNALETQFPAAEKRFCVMHLYQNLCKESRSLGVRREMWGAAKSTTDYFFNMHMENNKKVQTQPYFVTCIQSFNCLPLQTKPLHTHLLLSPGEHECFQMVS